jgi:hypothetical protein
MTRRFYVVSGGRDYADYAHVARVLNEERPDVVVQGEWCRIHGVPCIGMEALWDFYGNPAGPIRNGWMFDLLPIYKLVAFPGGRGTNNAVYLASQRNILLRDERRPTPDTRRMVETGTGSMRSTGSGLPEGPSRPRHPNHEV